MTIVLYPGQSVADLIGPANRSCPRCCGALRRWGKARWRVVRDSGDEHRIQPGRVRCGDCGVTQVVLPAEVLLRRRDAAGVITMAWQLAAAGAGARRAARLLGLPMETVRGWLRRLRERARLKYGGPAGDDRRRLLRTMAFVQAEAKRAAWPADQPIGRFLSYRTQGNLLCNTSWPYTPA